VSSGAFVQIEFPTDPLVFEFDTNLNLLTTLGGIFGGKNSNAGFEVDSINLVFETTEGTPSWSPPT
jgi:hypothetical protein